MKSCNNCIQFFDTTHVECVYCGCITCIECAKSILIQSLDNKHCMTCEKEWNLQTHAHCSSCKREWNLKQ